MHWLEIAVHTTEEATDAVVSALNDLGIFNLEISDHKPVTGLEPEGDYPELYPDLPPDDGSAVIRFWLNTGDGAENPSLFNSGTGISENGEEIWDQARVSRLLADLRLRLLALKKTMDIGTGEITESMTGEEDWENSWKQFFHGSEIGDLLICPTWEEPEDSAGKKILRIDPGLAFGTGAHETTQLVTEAIQSLMKPESRVLDCGCGSGILSMIALRYGAKSVVMTDIDPLCVDAVRENFERNGLGNVSRFPEEHSDREICIGDLTKDKAIREEIGSGRVDFICANILTDILIPMAPFFYEFLGKDGLCAASGIIDGRQEDVKRAFLKAGFSTASEKKLGDWWGIVFRKD